MSTSTRRYAVPFPSLWSHQLIALVQPRCPGFVGHSGKQGCRVYCGITGRRRDVGDPHYYPVMLKPDSYMINGMLSRGMLLSTIYKKFPTEYQRYIWKETSSILLSARTLAQYSTRYRLQTGLCKPTLFSGVTTLGVPGIFTMDLMHLSVLNDPDLLLWDRGEAQSNIIRPMIPPPGTGLFSATKRSGELTVTLSRRRLHLFPRHSKACTSQSGRKD